MRCILRRCQYERVKLRLVAAIANPSFPGFRPPAISAQLLFMKSRIAFLGLGIMGGGMARRLCAAGFPTTVYNRNQTKAAPLNAAGAVVASSPREAAKGAEVSPQA